MFSFGYRQSQHFNQILSLGPGLFHFNKELHHVLSAQIQLGQAVP
jgi:hypothetical protein